MITIKDVACEAGVPVATVSRVHTNSRLVVPPRFHIKGGGIMSFHVVVQRLGPVLGVLSWLQTAAPHEGAMPRPEATSSDGTEERT